MAVSCQGPNPAKIPFEALETSDRLLARKCLVLPNGSSILDKTQPVMMDKTRITECGQRTSYGSSYVSLPKNTVATLTGREIVHTVFASLPRLISHARRRAKTKSLSFKSRMMAPIGNTVVEPTARSRMSLQ